ncbi:type I-E CRISPR-associated protein Cas6/Cse3/CasE [Aerococcus sanguinicola]|uniref:type I-E CRISPR-associated protein Cas6/Cse3/CasE n=1 Tax=unclassified Aerococcus TaxID=2618060 RepID=UPI0008A161F9|nr:MULTISPECIES: type I-E CRISPR-associated protein Cas6/Cse3/CasE [unclassified Aerococcus]KAB0647998.1 type I-E CRISPR-associated protein Cas6/Cse3/CasE [Aerococcus sanguinicola]MDK6233504.1 type I-E CRISPR-associated protein Cas6/Cse3/CasE [Aerococcus sp. UMB10185]MDK6855513.1 type I-E CRISPR-associated protein Cas6/Cse3/CasE [Aerococcus sp. UMB7533]MDK8502233.1 type I-E CRISPR-associated protein Cas6/Cse3/CasE [Aerococcus sp. UMB1112A]OFN02356.1 type I-E CRISPR-associated protein Cas6/Cse3
MYLSRVQIDSHNRQKIKDLTHAGAYHNWVERSFPEEFESGERSRKLWRLDRLQGKDYLLLVSEEKPDKGQLERYGVPGSAETKSYDAFLSQIEEGMRLAFRVTLNPVISKSSGEQGERGRVMPHVTEEHQRQFLLDRSEKNGFLLKEEDFKIVESKHALVKKTGQRNLRLIQVAYEGVLTVADKEQFIKTLTQGFGKKKAYGFGLMTVIPLRD